MYSRSRLNVAGEISNISRISCFDGGLLRRNRRIEFIDTLHLAHGHVRARRFMMLSQLIRNVDPTMLTTPHDAIARACGTPSPAQNGATARAIQATRNLR